MENRQITHRYDKFVLTLELVDSKGQQWYDRDCALEPEIQLLRRHRLIPGVRVFDLGAHQGVVALALAHIVGEHGSVIALEAMPFDAAAAQRNQELNRLRNLTVLHTAVASQPGTVEMVPSGRISWGDRSLPTVSVSSTTIDALASEYGTPDILFIDVDGYEIEALKGERQVLVSEPDCYIEVHSELLTRYSQRAQDVLHYFPTERYNLYVSHTMRPSQREFTPLDLGRHDFSRGFHLVAISKNSNSTCA